MPRIGRMSIDLHMIEKDPAKVSALFSKMQFVPVRAETMFHSKTVDYMGISPLFGDISHGAKVPEYVAICKNNDCGELESVGVKRID